MNWKKLVSGYDLLGALFRHLPGRSENTTKYNLNCRLKFWCVAATKKNPCLESVIYVIFFSVILAMTKIYSAVRMRNSYF